MYDRRRAGSLWDDLEKPNFEAESFVSRVRRSSGARLTWSCLGRLALVYATSATVAEGTGWLTSVDGFFALVVGLILVDRWVEHRSGSATTAPGKPATYLKMPRLHPGSRSLAIVAWKLSESLLTLTWHVDFKCGQLQREARIAATCDRR